MRQAWSAAALLLTAAPAWADVNAGVDAWSPGEFRESVAEWRGPAVAGDADAQFNLAQAYKLGRGVPTDLPVAEGWYRKAAAQSHTQAEDNLGLTLFQQGKKADALPWLETSAARDERRAELVLGTMLFNGDGVAKDWPRAYALVTRASQQGQARASQTLAQMDGYVSPDQKGQGMELARRIAQTARRAAVPTPPGPAAPPPPRPGETPPRTMPGPVRDQPLRPPPSVGRLAPKPTPVRATPPARGGGWRIQLGAFRDEANARARWSQVGGRTGGTLALAKGGGVTRLQATGFASRAAARAACARARVSCVVVAP